MQQGSSPQRTGEVAWRVGEAEGQRLQLLRRETRAVYPPPREEIVEGTALVRQGALHLVYSEAGSGMTTFENAMLGYAKSVDALPAMLDCRSSEAWARSTKALGLDSGPVELNRVLDILMTRKEDRYPFLIVRSVEDAPRTANLPTDWPRRQLDSLRSMVDATPGLGAGVLFLGHDDTLADPFNATTSSFFQDVADTWRLPHFTAEELSEAWARGEQTGLLPGRLRGWAPPAVREAAEACVEWTGGQPLLAEAFGERLPVEAPGAPGSAPLREALQAVGSWLVDHPPAALSAWRRQLAQTFFRFPTELPTFIKECQRGARIPVGDLFPETRCLYTSGWLGESRRTKEGLRWGFSRCHQRWAREVVLAPDRFWPGGGGQ